MNYYNIIIYLQNNKFDANNEKKDEFINQVDDIMKQMLIEQLKIDIIIDFFSSRYVATLFSIFNNNSLFCF